MFRAYASIEVTGRKRVGPAAAVSLMVRTPGCSGAGRTKRQGSSSARMRSDGMKHE